MRSLPDRAFLDIVTTFSLAFSAGCQSVWGVGMSPYFFINVYQTICVKTGAVIAGT
jgi:hypothetical protein